MKTRRTYPPVRIDFTPFVSVALLLIVFFMWLKTVRKPTLLPMNVPDGFGCYYGEYPDADANLFLLANNRIGFITYRGSTAELIETNYSAEGIRKELLCITLNHAYGALCLLLPPGRQRSKIWSISWTSYESLVISAISLLIIRPLKKEPC